MMEDQTPEEPRLSHEEHWDLIFSLFGSAKDSFAEYGGGEAYLRWVRAAWGESRITSLECDDEP